MTKKIFTFVMVSSAFFQNVEAGVALYDNTEVIPHTKISVSARFPEPFSNIDVSFIPDNESGVKGISILMGGREFKIEAQCLPKFHKLSLPQFLLKKRESTQGLDEVEAQILFEFDDPQKISVPLDRAASTASLEIEVTGFLRFRISESFNIEYSIRTPELIAFELNGNPESEKWTEVTSCESHSNN